MMERDPVCGMDVDPRAALAKVERNFHEARRPCRKNSDGIR